MVKKILCFCVILLLGACAQQKAVTPEEQQYRLDKMNVALSDIYEKIMKSEGKQYLSLRDDYFDLKYDQIRLAEKYTSGFTLEGKTEDELRRMAYIAGIAGEESAVVRFIREDFRRFPEANTVTELVLDYFNKAYLLEPAEVVKHVNFSMFPPGDELYCHAMLTLGFIAHGDLSRAEGSYATMTELAETIRSKSEIDRNVPWVYFMGLQSYLAFQLGHKEEAEVILATADGSFTGGADSHQLAMYKKRLELLGNHLPDIQAREWIGTRKPVEPASLNGKVLLLSFFTWDCEECTLHIPQLNRLLERVGNPGFVLLGLTRFTGKYEHTENLTREEEYSYLKKHYYPTRKINWPLAVCEDDVMDNFGVYSVPVYLLIDKQGRVLEGYYHFNFSYLETRIKQLLNENS